MNSFEVLLPCIACAVKPVSNEDLVAAARPINPCGEKLGYDSRALLTMVHSSTSLVKALPILISLHTCSVMSSVYLLAPVSLLCCHPWAPNLRRRFRMQLDDRTFRLFRHDVHHAYLLLHQAFLQLPPIQLLTLEPMPLPCHEDLNQPPPLEPYTASTPPLQSEIEVPSDHEEEDNKIFMLATDQQLPHLAPQAKFPSPVRHVPAPDATELPMPSTIPSKSPLRSPPDTTRRHRRTTKPRKDKEPANAVHHDPGLL